MNLEELADLLRSRNQLDQQISMIIGRPATAGHIAEFVAAAVFDIDLEEAANNQGYDGHFRTGPVGGRSVNVKFTGKNEGSINLNDPPPEFYLCLTGPDATAGPSRGTSRPWVIDSIFIFEALPLHTALTARGLKLGTATSVINALWATAKIYPDLNTLYELSQQQIEMLRLFSSPN
jgi:hypothetical protein